MPAVTVPAAPHALDTSRVIACLDVEPDRGLGKVEAHRRRQRFGANRLRDTRTRPLAMVLVDQLKGVIVWLLAAAAVASWLFGDIGEAVAILAVLAINSGIGFVTELRAVRSMEALRRLARVTAKVRRGGRLVEIPADMLVPGDVVVVGGGDIVSADLRIIEAANLQCDESALTGESMPVIKSVDPVPDDAPVGERRSMLFKGTSVASGSGAGLVVATGMATELGRITQLVATAGPAASPLEARLDRLGAQLAWVTLALTATLALAGVLTGRELVPMIKTAVALAIAAVPEGLPIVATVALARGMWRMAQRNALIERLSAVETLGATTVILTDKTGTLTENRMSVVGLALAEGEVAVRVRPAAGQAAFARDGAPVSPREESLASALRVAVLCNEATLGDGPAAAGIGDPTELALLQAGRCAGLERATLLEHLPERGKMPFSTDTNMMATLHGVEGHGYLAVKGAPEPVIAASTRELTASGVRPLDDGGRARWRAGNENLAAEGLRVLALASRDTDAIDDDPYRDLTLIGLVGLLDPPRADVGGAIAACQAAGVRIVMLTGDQLATARKIAVDVGLAGDDELTVVDAGTLPDNLADIAPADRERLLRTRVFARISPRAKLELVAMHQANGDIVAMTGDGVNDAPALKKADIGIAMGCRGTQVAREAAHMVLRDDSFPSIVAAMEQGRVIFVNIRKFVVYLLSCNLSEILVITMATLSGLPLPLLPLQILYLNLVTDVFPAFALGVGEGPPDVMRRPPRDPREPLIGRRHWLTVLGHAATITLATLGAFLIAPAIPGASHGGAVSISFLTLALAQLWHVFNMRERSSSRLVNEVTRNPWIWAALAVCLTLIAVAFAVPALATLLSLRNPGLAGLGVAVGLSLLPLLLGGLTGRLGGAAGR